MTNSSEHRQLEETTSADRNTGAPRVPLGRDTSHPMRRRSQARRTDHSNEEARNRRSTDRHPRVLMRRDGDQHYVK